MLFSDPGTRECLRPIDLYKVGSTWVVVATSMQYKVPATSLCCSYLPQRQVELCVVQGGAALPHALLVDLAKPAQLLSTPEVPRRYVSRAPSLCSTARCIFVTVTRQRPGLLSDCGPTPTSTIRTASLCISACGPASDRSKVGTASSSPSAAPQLTLLCGHCLACPACALLLPASAASSHKTLLDRRTASRWQAYPSF